VADGPAERRLSPLFTWRSAIASEHGPRDHSFADGRSIKGPTIRHVALTLSLHMNELGGSCFPAQETVAEQAGLSRMTVSRAVRALEELGWLVVRPGGGRGHPNVYSAAIPETVTRGDPFKRETVTGGPLNGTPGLQEDVKEDVNPSPTEIVREAWLAESALTRHRPSYFDDAVRRAVAKAVAKYGLDDVQYAIGNYAAVLASPDHYWSHRWTLVEFLKRGLDRFVPEADPLANFRRERDRVDPARQQRLADLDAL